jgi:hypothetical protein
MPHWLSWYGDCDLGWASRGSSFGKGKAFSNLQNVQTCSGAHAAPYSMGTGFVSRAKNSWGLNLTTNLHLAQRLRMTVDIQGDQKASVRLMIAVQKQAKIF